MSIHDTILKGRAVAMSISSSFPWCCWSWSSSVVVVVWLTLSVSRIDALITFRGLCSLSKVSPLQLVWDDENGEYHFRSTKTNRGRRQLTDLEEPPFLLDGITMEEDGVADGEDGVLLQRNWTVEDVLRYSEMDASLRIGIEQALRKNRRARAAHYNATAAAEAARNGTTTTTTVVSVSVPDTTFRRRLLQFVDDPPDTINVRFCRCAQRTVTMNVDKFFFCSEKATHCVRPGALGPTASCVVQSTATGLARSLWPVTISFLFMSLLCVLCTIPGRNAVDYVVSLCYPRWNNIVVTTMERRDPERADVMIRRYLETNSDDDDDRVLDDHILHRIILRETLRQNNNNAFGGGGGAGGGGGRGTEQQASDNSNTEGERPPTTLALKTKIFTMSPSPASSGTSNASAFVRSASVRSIGSGSCVTTTTREPQPKCATITRTDETDDLSEAAAEGAAASSSKTLDESASVSAESSSSSTGGAGGQEQQQSCSICFGTIKDGDRIGALDCSHAFHVDCLKGWLKRRNVCPLCLTADIATPQFDDDHHAVTTAATGSSSSRSNNSNNNNSNNNSNSNSNSNQEHTTTTDTTTGVRETFEVAAAATAVVNDGVEQEQEQEHPTTLVERR